MSRRLLIFIVSASIAAPAVSGQAVEASSLAVPQTEATSEPFARLPAGVTIPALTPVSIEIRARLGSKISRTGETFPLQLAAPIVIDGKEIVAAGTPGMGEVVHAKKAGGSGAGGELVLAARYLDVAGQRLRLRSMRLALSGTSNIHKVDAFNAASAASPIPIGLIGFFITGGQTVVAEGSLADAKTAEPFILPQPVPVVPASPQAPGTGGLLQPKGN